MAKSKTQQYISRRQSGQSPEEARKRSYLKQSGAWKAEQKYQQITQAWVAAQKAQLEQDSRERMAAEADREARRAEEVRRKRLAALNPPDPPPAPPRPPRCKVCSSDYCTSPAHALQPEAFLPITDYGFITPTYDPTLDTSGDAGLSGEFLRELAENNPGERVEAGIWSSEKGFVSHADQLEADFNARQEAAHQLQRTATVCPR